MAHQMLPTPSIINAAGLKASSSLLCTASTHSHLLRVWFSALRVAPTFTPCKLHEVIQIKKGIRFGVHTVLE